MVRQQKYWKQAKSLPLSISGTTNPPTHSHYRARNVHCLKGQSETSPPPSPCVPDTSWQAVAALCLLGTSSRWIQRLFSSQYSLRNGQKNTGELGACSWKLPRNIPHCRKPTRQRHLPVESLWNCSAAIPQTFTAPLLSFFSYNPQERKKGGGQGIFPMRFKKALN